MNKFYYNDGLGTGFGSGIVQQNPLPLDLRTLTESGNNLADKIGSEGIKIMYDGFGPMFVQSDGTNYKRGWYYLDYSNKAQPKWVGIYDKPQVDALIKDLGTIYKVSGNKTLDEILALNLSDESLRGNVYNVSSVGTGKAKGTIPGAKSPDGKEQDVYIGDQILVNAQGKLDNLRGFIDFTDYQTKTISTANQITASGQTTVEGTIKWLYDTQRVLEGTGIKVETNSTTAYTTWKVNLLAATTSTIGGIKHSGSVDTSKTYNSLYLNDDNAGKVLAPGLKYTSTASKYFLDTNSGLLDISQSKLNMSSPSASSNVLKLDAPGGGTGITLTTNTSGQYVYNLDKATSSTLGGIIADSKGNSGSWTEVKIGSNNKLYVPEADTNTDNTKIVVGNNSVSKDSSTGVTFKSGTNTNVNIKDSAVEISSKMSARIDGVQGGITPDQILFRGASNIYLHYGKSATTASPVDGDTTNYSHQMITIMNNFGDYGKEFTRYSHATGTTIGTETSKYFHGLVPPATHSSNSDTDKAARAISFLNENGEWATVESIPTLNPWKIVTGGTDGKITTGQSHNITEFTPIEPGGYLTSKLEEYENPDPNIEYRYNKTMEGEAEWASSDKAGKIADRTGHLLFIDKDGGINEDSLGVAGEIKRFYDAGNGSLVLHAPDWKNSPDPDNALVRIGNKYYTKDGKQTTSSLHCLLADYLEGTNTTIEPTDINDHNNAWASGMLTYRYERSNGRSTKSYLMGSDNYDLGKTYYRVIRSYPGLPKHNTNIGKLSTLNWNSRAQQFSYYDWDNQSKYLGKTIPGGGFDTYHNTNSTIVTMNRVFEMGGVETYNTSQGTHDGTKWVDNSQERIDSWSTISNGWLLHIPMIDEDRNKYKSELTAEEYDDKGVTKKRWVEPDWLDNWKCNSVIVDKTGLYHTAPANGNFYPIDCVKRWKSEIQVLSDDIDKAPEGEWKTLFAVDEMIDGFDLRINGHYAHVKFKNINSDTTGFAGNDQNKYILPKDFKAYITWTDSSENNAKEPLVLIKVVVNPKWWWSPGLNSMNFNNTDIEVKAALNPKRWSAGSTTTVLGLTKVLTGKFIANMDEIKCKVSDVFGLNTAKRITFEDHDKWMGYTHNDGISYADYEKTSTSTWEENGKTVTQKITDYYYFTEGLFGPQTTSGSKTIVSSQTPSAAGESWRSRKTEITRNGTTTTTTTGYHYFFEDGGVYKGQVEDWNETSKPTATDSTKTVWNMTSATFPHFYYSTIAETLDDDKTIKFTFWDKNSDTLREYDVFIK